MTRTEIFAQLTEQAKSTYKWKNHDYGDSFAKTRSIIPQAILVRLHDKLNRLTTLLTGEDAKVKDESIEDTLLDLANYALMELTERIYERQSIPDECEYNKDGRCFAQKNAPACDSNPVFCDIRKSDC